MIALIPARKGSKGLPGKNFKPLLGKPLICYAIEEALKAKFVTSVYVSSDDPEIKDIVSKYKGVVFSERPSQLATDQANAIDTYLYMIRVWKELELNSLSFVVLQPTSPLRTSQNIDEAIAMFKKKDADSVVSYTKEAHPISWHTYLDDENRFDPIFDGALKNRQMLRTSYYPNGAIYVFRTNLIEQGKYYSSRSYAYLMSRKQSVDIDDIDDFNYAEFLLKEMVDG